MKATIATTQLGDTGLQISRIGFGAWAIGGGGWEFSWGPQDDDESVAAIHRALELGINWIDTAAAYGFGHSEDDRRPRSRRAPRRRAPLRVHQGIAPQGSRRHRVNNLRRDSILREAESSLKRLKVDAIDLYQIHWPIPDEDIEEGWSAFAELKEQGLVRHIGVSNFDVEQLRRIRAYRSRRDAPAALLADRARRREGDPALRRARADRRHRLLAHGLGPADRRDDPRAHREPARRRLAPPRRALPRAPALGPSGARGAAEGDRRAGSTRLRARSPSPGRCATRPSTARSSASGGPIRSMRS